MKKVRIGNDISVTWSIKDNGTPINMTDYDASVRLYDAYMNECKSTWSVGPDNVYLYFSAVDQDRLGVYTIVLELKDKVTGGVYTIDSGNAFELVLRTEMAGGPDSDDVKVVSHELSSDLSVVVPGLKGVNVEEHLVFEKGFASKGDIIVDDIVIDTRRVETIDLSPEVTLDGFVPSERHVPSTKAMAKYVGKYIETHGTSGGGGFREIKVGDESIDAELTPVVKLSARDKSKDHLSVDIENNGVVIGLTDKAVENLGRAANSLQKTGDTATGLITFEAGLQIGTEKVTVVDTSKDVLNANNDNSLPTSKAVVENTLSSKTEDTAKGKITFEDGLAVGKYEPLMSGGFIDNDGGAELKSLKLRESLIVPEIKYNRATVFKGIQYLSFGGGVIESVTERVDGSGTFTLKLEDGEEPSVKKGDLCVGYWHFLNGNNNEGENSDNHKGTFKIAGFCTIYFEIYDVKKGVVTYLLRKNKDGTFYSGVHPQKGLNFACIANTNTTEEYADRHACKITTTDYEIRLQNLYNWEYSSDNIYRIEGKLDGFSMVADLDGKSYLQEFKGHGVVFGNAYMYGTLHQFDREVWSMVLWYENDNLLSDTPKLLSCQVYRNGIKVDYSNDRAGGTYGNISYTRISEASDGDWNDKHSSNTGKDIWLTSSDLPDGYDTATFQVTAVCYSMGVDGTNSNVTSVSESVTFHRLKQGTEGRGIIDVREFYAVSDDNVNAPTDWKSPSYNETIPTTTKDKRYLWNYEEIEYNKEDELGDKIKKTTPAVIGTYGDDGRGIKSITDYYLVSDLGSGVTTDTDEFNWQKEPPKTDPVKKYLWNYEVIEYDKKGADGKTSVTTPPAIIGTHGEKGEDGNDGKDAVQSNYMDGTSVDGTVERNEWRVNIKDADDNPYRTHPTNPYFDGFSHLTINPVTFGRVLRISGEVEASPTTVASDGYYVLQTKFDLSWVKGIVQPIGSLNNLYCYAETYFGEVLQTTGTIDVGDTTGREIKSISVQVASARTNSVPSSFSNSSLLYADYYLFIKVSATLSDGKIISKISGGIQNTTGSAVQVNASAITYYTIVDKAGKSSNIKPKQINSTDTWIGYTKNPSKPINAKINVTHGFPTNTSNLQIFLRVRGIYSTKDSYFVYRNLKVELYDEKRKENTAYIPSENDKARATNVNLLDGTRNGMNSEGKEIWTKTTNNRGTITFGDNLFTLTSSQAGNGGNAMYITSPTINLLEGNYTLSFDMKMVNCYGARLVINGTPHSTIASTTDWATHRILLPKYSGEKTFRFDSFLSTAAGTTSHLYIRNIKLEEGCFGTAWTISENDKGGKSGFTYRPCGTYDKTVLYVANNEVRDVVYYKDDKGNTGYYICRVSNQGKTPPENPTLWEKSSYIKFLSVEALFADNLFADAIQSGSGYFDGLNAKTVKISGELNATSGTFDNVVINGAYNKLFQVIDERALGNFFYYNEKDDNYYPLLHSWGDAIRINRDLIGSLNVYLPALVPEIFSDKIRVRPWEGYKKTSEGIKSMTMDDVRSLIGRQFVIYLEDADSTMNFKANAIRKRQQYEQNEFNALSSEGSVWEVNGYGSETEAGVGVDGGMVLVLELKVGYRRLKFNSYTYYYEMLYWDATTINTLDKLIE